MSNNLFVELKDFFGTSFGHHHQCKPVNIYLASDDGAYSIGGKCIFVVVAMDHLHPFHSTKLNQVASNSLPMPWLLQDVSNGDDIFFSMMMILLSDDKSKSGQW